MRGRIDGCLDVDGCCMYWFGGIVEDWLVIRMGMWYGLLIVVVVGVGDNK